MSAVTITVVHQPNFYTAEPKITAEETERIWQKLVAEGYGHIMTSEGFTVRETRDLLYGNPDGALDPFDGLLSTGKDT